jgi:uncharacterized protein YjbJ (UPF0337 family)
MGVGDKLSAGLDKLKGKAEEAVGKATGDEKLVAEGRADQIKGEAKHAAAEVKEAAEETGDRLKDAAHDVGEHVKDAADTAKDAIDDRRNR